MDFAVDQPGKRQKSFMERTKKDQLLYRLHRIAALILLTFFIGGGVRAATAAGFDPVDYKLCGVTMVEKTAAQVRGFAIIEYLRTGKQSMYRQGDMLSGARIARIDKNSITLVMENKKYVLRVETSGSAAIAQPARSLTPTATPPGVTQQSSHQVYHQPGSIIPEPTIEEVLKNIEQEQREQKR